MENRFDVPILFVIFNREETASKTFQSIRNVAPRKLYIASDGARNEEEEKIVDKVRKRILDSIDWKCEVKTLFQDKNLGCGKGVYTAVDWLFKNEDLGIILEDDCIATPTFFPFVKEMLSRYENDSRIGMIAGYNPFPQDPKVYPYSYFFSRYKSCWGWATWKRAWANMDLSMNWRNTPFLKSVISNSGYHGKDSGKWLFEIKAIDRNYVSAWDWQWYFSLAAQNQLCVYPQFNQISNIGFDDNATHTSFLNDVMESRELEFPLSDPPYVCPYENFGKDFYKYDHTFRAVLSRAIPPVLKDRIKGIIKKILYAVNKYTKR